MKKAQLVREHMPYGKILVVDDMETNLYVARGFLLPYDLTVETALSGQEAIAKIERRNYDMVFMDHMMPVMDGIEAVKIIREKGYTLPIVALTANAVAGQAEMFLANGFDGFISKPIDIRELNASLNKFVRDRQPPEVIEAARAAHATVTVEPPQVDANLAKIFERDAAKAMVVLQEYEGRGSYEDDDLHMYIVNVHALKSALANIGETNLSALAAELEQAGRERSINLIANKTPAFLSELLTVIDKLKSNMAEYGTGVVSDEDVAHLRKMLLVIKSACAEYDIVTARAALKDLKLKPWAHHYTEFLDNITEHLLNSDFEKAEAVCEACLAGNLQ
jgi:CheY-like chemotaxis protein